MQYHVRALSPDRLMIELTIDASDEAEARRQAEARGLYVAAVSATAGRSAVGGASLSLTLFSQELLALLNAGLSIVESLEAMLEKEASTATRAVLTRLLAGLREGKRFSTVLAEQPALFAPLYVGLIRAAEGTSDLPRSLARYLDYRQRFDNLRAKIVSAAIYPAILFVVGGGVAAFLIGFVVPRFASVYKDAGRDLPWLSQLLLDWGAFAAAHANVLIGGALLLLLLAAVGAHRLLGGGNLTQLAGRLPGIGARVRLYELSRLYLTLGMLLEGGIPIVAALETVRDAVGPETRRQLQAAQGLIQSGTPLSSAFASQDLTTPISLRMLRVGERSGELGQMLSQSAAFYDGEIARWVDRFSRIFEPVLMVAIGLVVGTIVVLLYLPIFDLAGSLS